MTMEAKIEVAMPERVILDSRSETTITIQRSKDVCCSCKKRSPIDLRKL